MVIYLNNSNFLISLYIFELWVERTKLLGNLDLPDCIAAFIHLCFTFGLEYPEVNINHKCNGINLKLLSMGEAFSIH